MSNTKEVISIDKNSWILDCARTQHICNDKASFRNLLTTNAEITSVHKEKINLNFVGTVDATCKGQKLCFTDMLYNPDSPANLVSLVVLLKKG